MGRLLSFFDKYNYFYEVLFNGEKLELLINFLISVEDKELVEKVIFKLIEKMLILDLYVWILIDEVYDNLKVICKEKLFKFFLIIFLLEKNKILLEGS